MTVIAITVEKAPPRGEAFDRCGRALADQLTRVQVWPPQNMPPKAQP
jgi:hypothetical protein